MMLMVQLSEIILDLSQTSQQMTMYIMLVVQEVRIYLEHQLM